jgi:Family of unknown function (DUF6221)
VTHPTDPATMWHGDRAPGEPLTLAEFLAARLDEDAARATEAEQAALESGEEFWPSVFAAYNEGFLSKEEAEHIGRHDPSRVLREVAAGREILAECSTLVIVGVAYPDEAGPESAARILQLLASVYSDHPDYQDKWKP